MSWDLTDKLEFPLVKDNISLLGYLKSKMLLFYLFERLSDIE